MAKALFGAGCFWGVEAAFRQVEGVLATAVGYSGGRLESPTYEDVCSGRTGHAEVVEVEYDPSKVSYDKLLDVFWHNVDPTVRDRQFCDIGHQYRTAIFTHSRLPDLCDMDLSLVPAACARGDLSWNPGHSFSRGIIFQQSRARNIRWRLCSAPLCLSIGGRTLSLAPCRSDARWTRPC